MQSNVDLTLADRDGRGGDLLLELAYRGHESAAEELIRRADVICPDGVDDDIMVPWKQMSGTALWNAARSGMGAAGLELARRGCAYERQPADISDPAGLAPSAISDTAHRAIVEESTPSGAAVEDAAQLRALLSSGAEMNFLDELNACESASANVSDDGR